MPALRARLFCGFAILLLAAGCSSTTQIQTAPPRPALTPPPDTTATTDLARLTVTVETGDTGLPEAIQAMQFRLAEIHLKPADGDWIVYPSDAGTFEISAGQAVRKSVLSTRVLPVAYASLALVLRDVFVFYDANAGGPLTLPRDTPLTLPLAATPTTNQPTILRLRFEPAASLTHGAHCRWFFLPFFETLIE